MKRFIAALLSVMLCLSFLSIGGSAFAAERVSARTPLAGSAWAKISNIEIAAAHINGMVVPYGTEFSFNNTVGPRTKAYGYQSALNGRGVKVTGGGVAQAATTLYLALCQLNQEIEFTEKKTYGSRFRDNYVSNANDAILVDYSSGTDFSFVNWGDDLTIEMWTTDSYLYCAVTAGAEEQEPILQWMPMVPLTPAQQRRPIASASLWIDGTDELRNNILLAAGSINDTILQNGDMFSFNDSVGPRVEKYGYKSALNGRGVKVTGGGVAQVASVIWLAVKNLDEVAIVEKSTYGSRYNQNYVSSSNDAILTDYSGGTDFSFRNTGLSPLTISTYVSGDMLFCDIYQN
ncbi:MAG: VanW family protein [Clostridia bacterium]|nr:VanW family protein [Clostridia bacterium]MBP3651594.1 VanW family protein [Clostridia bacterium]